MDDFKLSNLYEAQNEYCARLVNILTPFIRQGIQSIFNESYKLCVENDEKDKYLMTFQNFLARVSKWNNTLVEQETQRILTESKCSYLEDLLTCVHITQLKVLTSVRVGQKQKKINIDVPKLSTFIHNVYIDVSRKIYKNVYLFDVKVTPLNHQKNMRECEMIIKECILNVIRESIPIEAILRSYIDKTSETEVTVEEEIIPEEDKSSEVNEKSDISDSNIKDTTDEIKNSSTNIIEDTSENIKKITTETDISEMQEEQNNVLNGGNNEDLQEHQNIIIKTDENNSISNDDMSNDNIVTEKSVALSFNDIDNVLNMDTNKEDEVSAPKTIERLETISDMRNEERKREEENEDDEMETLTINSDLDPNELDGVIEQLDEELMKLTNENDLEDDLGIERLD